jgi:hypothetical protein
VDCAQRELRNGVGEGKPHKRLLVERRGLEHINLLFQSVHGHHPTPVIHATAPERRSVQLMFRIDRIPTLAV